MAVFVKICGVTNVADAASAVEFGADAVGVNLVEGSKRFVDVDTARRIVQAIAGRAVTVAVVANASRQSMESFIQRTGVARIQLHGDEPPDVLIGVLPMAYKAVRIGSVEDVRVAESYPGDPLLVDASVPGQLGGTSQTFDWTLVRELSRSRRLMLAGGLHPDNVGDAIAVVRPWGVDVASGVEYPNHPRRKDPVKLRLFIEAARRAE